MRTITFDNSAKKFILETFDKTIDLEGFIVEKSNPSQRVLTPDGQELREDEFAAIKKGSEIYIKSDLISLVRLVDQIENKNGSIK